MSPGLTDEQLEMRRTLIRFVDEKIRPVALEWERDDRYPSEIVDGMCELGLFGITVPEQYGGLALDPVSIAIVFEELSRGWMGIAGILGSHSMATFLIAEYGTDDQKQRFLPELATGTRKSGLALTEPNAGSDLQGIMTTARPVDGGYVLNGTKTWITNARHADPLPVLVKTDPSAQPRHRGMSVMLVNASTDGFRVGKELGKLGYKGPESCEVIFDDAFIPCEDLLGGKEGSGLKHALSALELGRINVAARSVGIAQEALDRSLQYSKEREAFGQPIAHFQAIQLKLADLATRVQAARLLTWWAADCLSAGGRADVETAMAKYFASEVALKSALDAMRIHGAYGYSTEFEIERLYRDAPLMAIGEGTSDILRLLIARRLLQDGGAG